MKKINRIIFILLVITPILSLTITEISQGSATIIQPSSLSYNAKVGESNTYQVTKAYAFNLNYITHRFRFPNRTFKIFNITVDAQFNIKIIQLNKTNTGNPDIFYNESLSLPGKTTFYFPYTYDSSINFSTIIQPGFNDQKTAEQYYNSLSSSIFNRGFGPILPLILSTGIPSVLFKGNFIALTYNGTFNNGNSNGSKGLSLEFNWKTGWLESINLKASYTNGTIIEQYQLQQESSSNIIDSIVSFSTSSIGLVTGISVLAIIIGVIGVAYSQYHTQITQGTLNESFLQYLQKKLKFSKRKKIEKSKSTMHKIDIDRYLDIIDEIIEENKSE